MPARRNQQVPNGHFHKKWQNNVRTWFDQPARKRRRRLARVAKAVRVFPRPVQGPLRPVVHPPTVKYNAKVRFGRGFTFTELKEAGIERHFAQTIGIAVDHRRRNKTDKTMKVNVQRLKEYKSKLVLFPRNAKKPKAGEADPKEKVEQQTGVVLPIKPRILTQETVKVSDIDTKHSAFSALRKARRDAHLVGVVEKKKKARAEKKAAESVAKGK